jgi:hypothetical protein
LQELKPENLRVLRWPLPLLPIDGPMNERRGRFTDAGYTEDTGATIYSDFETRPANAFAAVDQTAIASNHQPLRIQIDL